MKMRASNSSTWPSASSASHRIDTIENGRNDDLGSSSSLCMHVSAFVPNPSLALTDDDSHPVDRAFASEKGDWLSLEAGRALARCT